MVGTIHEIPTTITNSYPSYGLIAVDSSSINGNMILVLVGKTQSQSVMCAMIMLTLVIS